MTPMTLRRVPSLVPKIELRLFLVPVRARWQGSMLYDESS